MWCSLSYLTSILSGIKWEEIIISWKQVPWLSNTAFHLYMINLNEGIMCNSWTGCYDWKWVSIQASSNTELYLNFKKELRGCCSTFSLICFSFSETFFQFISSMFKYTEVSVTYKVIYMDIPWYQYRCLIFQFIFI